MKKLVLTPTGGAELRDDESVLWSSIDDPDFSDTFEDAFLNEDDLSDILDYLIEEKHIKASESQNIECVEESEDESEDDNDEDDEDDD